MFERNPIDNLNATAIAVEVRLKSGQVITGRAALDKGKSVHHLLRGEDDFLYVELSDGDADFVPKAAIEGMKIVRPVIPQALRQPSHSDQGLDPARILGVNHDAPWAEIKAAYHQMLKAYHPDKYAGVDLPAEVATYLDAKAKQITQAFRLLKSARSGRTG